MPRSLAWEWLRDVVDSAAGAPYPSDIAVAAIIASHLNRAGQAWPSVKTLTIETRLDRKAILHATERLEEAGLLTVTRRPGHGNLYTVATYSDAGQSNRRPTARRRGDRSHEGTGPMRGPVADRSHEGTQTENGPPLKQEQPQLDHPPPAARTRTSIEPDLLSEILELRGTDARTATTVTAFARRGLPEGAFRNALEATRDAAGRLKTTEIAYFVGTLQRLEAGGQYG